MADPLLPDDTEVTFDGLKRVREVKDYKSMSPLERAEAIHGIFESPCDWNNTKILLLDDVLTTGAIVTECAQVLRASKASEVRIVAFGKDQQIFVKKECRVCTRPMRIRTNNQTGEKFWGCSGYPPCRYTESM